VSEIDKVVVTSVNGTILEAPVQTGVTLSDAISELNSELNLNKTANNEFTLKIPQVIKVAGVDSGLIYDKQVFDSFTIDLIKPPSIINIAAVTL